MQITDMSTGGTFSPTTGGDESAKKFANDLRRQRRYHQLIRLRRTIGFWWYRLLLIVIAGLATPFLAPVLIADPKIFFGGIGAIVLLFFVVRYADWGLLLIAIFSTAFFPAVLQVKSLKRFPCTTIDHIALLYSCCANCFSCAGACLTFFLVNLAMARDHLTSFCLRDYGAVHLDAWCAT